MGKTKPTSPANAGHSKTRFNAVKHGLTSTRAVLPGESRRDYESLYAELVEEWQPDGVTETRRVREIADLEWRLQRFHRAEAAAIRFALGESLMLRFVPGHESVPRFEDIDKERLANLRYLLDLIDREPESAEEKLGDVEAELEHVMASCQRLLGQEPVAEVLAEQSERVREAYEDRVDLDEGEIDRDPFKTLLPVLSERRQELVYQREILAIYTEIHDAAIYDVASSGFYNNQSRYEAHLHRTRERVMNELVAIKKFKRQAVKVD